MIHKEVINIFVKFKNAYEELYCNDSGINLLESNGIGLFIYPDIPINIEILVKRNFSLFDGEKVLFISDISLDGSLNEGMIITDCRLLFIIGSEYEINIYWIDIDKVEFCGNKLCFYSSFGEESKLEVDMLKFF